MAEAGSKLSIKLKKACGIWGGKFMSGVSEKKFSKAVASRVIGSSAKLDTQANAKALAAMLAYIPEETSVLNAPLTKKLTSAALDALRLELKLDTKNLF